MNLKDTSAMIISPDLDFAGEIETHLESGQICLIYKIDDPEKIYPVLKEKKVDFVLIDDVPPELDGIAITRKMRTDDACPNPEVNIFLFTAEIGSIERSLLAVNAGAHELFSKPICEDRILSRIHSNIVEPRSFIKTQKYAGPDRRRTETADGENKGRRASDR